jgi:cell wall-associated NlpC family hydrolase
MKEQKRRIIAISLTVLVVSLFLLTGCAPSPEETQRETKYYEQKYADEPEPEGDVARLLEVLDGCVGGQYVFAGQGNQITRQFIDTMYKKYPDYFSDGRLEYLQAIADDAAANGYDYPADYAWDCSGLWWYAASDVLNLYGTPTDRTAQDTYDDYCTPITKDELRPGDLVFVEGVDGKIAHMAVVGRHGYIYEAPSGFCGVVLKRTVDKRVYYNIVNTGEIYVGTNWNKFGRPKIFE